MFIPLVVPPPTTTRYSGRRRKVRRDFFWNARRDDARGENRWRERVEGELSQNKGERPNPDFGLRSGEWPLATERGLARGTSLRGSIIGRVGF
jgi:hypothetical protein